MTSLPAVRGIVEASSISLQISDCRLQNHGHESEQGVTPPCLPNCNLQSEICNGLEVGMRISIPELSLVLLVGPSGCGKSTFARRHFRPTEIVSSDHYRAVVTDDESAQHASRDAFELVHHVVEKRLLWRRFTVVDATNLKAEGRKPLLELARRHHYLVSAIVFDLP